MNKLILSCIIGIETVLDQVEPWARAFPIMRRMKSPDEDHHTEYKRAHSSPEPMMRCAHTVYCVCDLGNFDLAYRLVNWLLRTTTSASVQGSS